MLKTLYDAIRKDSAPVNIVIDDRDYCDKQLYPVHEPLSQTLVVSSLTALCDYIHSDIDDLKANDLLCHVVSPEEVAIRSKMLGQFCDRACFIRAELNQLKLPFGQWMEAEPFNIALQACFDDPEGFEPTDKELVLKFTSNIASIAENSVSDDGISQAVTVKAGIVSKTVKTLPNPVNLRPYRTFTEIIPQPASKFIFRVKQESGRIFYCLTEADGGAWRSEAMRKIKIFMKEAIPELNVIS